LLVARSFQGNLRKLLFGVGLIVAVRFSVRMIHGGSSFRLFFPDVRAFAFVLFGFRSFLVF